MPGRWDRVP